MIYEALDIENDSAYVKNTEVKMEVATLGRTFSAWNSSETWCMGDYDPHTTICLEKQNFAVLISETGDGDYYELPLNKYKNSPV